MTHWCARAGLPLRSARLDLRDGDTDGTVNRSYYAMVHSAQAALLSSGVPEEKLPRTHSGLISAFGEHAVKSGKVDPELGRAISKAESLRLRADYTGVELDSRTAENALISAERFVQSVGEAFGLERVSERTEIERSQENPGDRIPDKIASLAEDYETLEERRSRGVREWMELQRLREQKRREAASKGVPREKGKDYGGEQREEPDISRGLDGDPDD